MSYNEVINGRFLGIMQWNDCYNLFDHLLNNNNDWYLNNTSENLPTTTLNSLEFSTKITEIQQIIKQNHKERYCGIVYSDDLENPNMIKIFHPNNLGKSCGSSESPPIPRWIISKIKPEKITKKEKIKKNLFF